MAHSCPICDEVCHCHGDLDDCLIDDDQALDACTHCDEFDEDDGVDEDDD